MDKLPPKARYRRIAKFQQDRPPVPKQAEQHLLNAFEIEMVHESNFAEGRAYKTYHNYCPSCQKLIVIEHGDRLLCECGLYMENYGNSFVIWKDIPHSAAKLFEEYAEELKT